MSQHPVAAVELRADAAPEPGHVTRTWIPRRSWTYGGFRGIWGTGDDELFAAIGMEGVLHWDGANWSALGRGDVSFINAVSGSSHTSVFAVGDRGGLHLWTGREWRREQSGTRVDLRGVWACPEAAIAVGDDGTVLRRDGDRWVAQQSGTEVDLLAVWGSGPDDVHAVGDAGTTIRWDGAAWRPVASGTDQPLRAIWGTGRTNIVAAGDSGTMVRWDGNAWARIETRIDANLRGLGGRGPDDMVAVGDDGMVLLWNGHRWWSQEVDVSVALSAVWGNAGGHVVIGGERGTVLHGVEGETELVGEAAADESDARLEQRRVVLPDGGRIELLLFEERGEPAPELVGTALQSTHGRHIVRGDHAWWSPREAERPGWRRYRVAAAFPDTLPAGRFVHLLALPDSEEFGHICPTLPIAYRTPQLGDVVISFGMDRFAALPIVELEPAGARSEGDVFRYAYLCPEVRWNDCVYSGPRSRLMAMDDPPLPPGGWVFEALPSGPTSPGDAPTSAEADLTIAAGEGAELRVALLGDRPSEWSGHGRSDELHFLGVWLSFRGRVVHLFNVATREEPETWFTPHHGASITRRGGRFVVWLWYREMWFAARVLSVARLTPVGEALNGRVRAVDPMHSCNCTICASPICPVELVGDRIGVAVFDGGEPILFSGEGEVDALVPGEQLPACGSPTDDRIYRPHCAELLRIRSRGTRCVTTPPAVQFDNP